MLLFLDKVKWGGGAECRAVFVSLTEEGEERSYQIALMSKKLIKCWWISAFGLFQSPFPTSHNHSNVSALSSILIFFNSKNLFMNIDF